MRRRSLLALAPLAAAPAYAQSRPIRFLQGFAPGGTTDILARLIAPGLSAALGAPVVVENRPGAGGTLAAEALARAAPDGTTIMLINNGFAVAAALYTRLPYDPIRDIAPIAPVASIGLVLLARPGTSLDAVLVRARANPGALNVATVGVGSTQHFVAEAFQAAAGISLIHIPYRGTPAALVALRNDEVQLVVETGAAVLGQTQSGELAALAITSPARSPLFPSTPTVAEALPAPGFAIETWYAIAAPAGTPHDRLVEATNATLADSALRARLAELGLAPRPPLDPAALRAEIAAEIARWSEIIRRTGMERP